MAFTFSCECDPNYCSELKYDFYSFFYNSMKDNTMVNKIIDILKIYHNDDR